MLFGRTQKNPIKIAAKGVVEWTALFYVLVIPTTMPGAFFWKNKGFIEHARDIGLADKPQVGVVHEGRHGFGLRDLLSSFRHVYTGSNRSTESDYQLEVK